MERSSLPGRMPLNSVQQLPSQSKIISCPRLVHSPFNCKFNWALPTPWNPLLQRLHLDLIQTNNFLSTQLSFEKTSASDAYQRIQTLRGLCPLSGPFHAPHNPIHPQLLRSFPQFVLIFTFQHPTHSHARSSYPPAPQTSPNTAAPPPSSPPQPPLVAPRQATLPLPSTLKPLPS